MAIVDAAEDVKMFGIRHSQIAFHTDKISPPAPVKVKAFYYTEGDEVIEDDHTNAGSPQVVSEGFKKLVEDFDPDAAQFFEVEYTNYTPVKKYYVMHVTKVVDCRDKRYGIRGYVDKNKVGLSDHLFRLKGDELKHIVSDRFRKEYKARGLNGSKFIQLSL